MNKFTPQQFMEELLQQAPQLTSAQYREYRRELDERMARAQREERSMRWIVAGAWAAALALFLLIRWLASFSNATKAWPESLQLALVAAVILCQAAALLLLAIYLFKYRRRVVQSRAEAQRAAIRELQRQLNELRAQLAPPPAAAPAPDTK